MFDTGRISESVGEGGVRAQCLFRDRLRRGHRGRLLSLGTTAAAAAVQSTFGIWTELISETRKLPTKREEPELRFPLLSEQLSFAQNCLQDTFSVGVAFNQASTLWLIYSRSNL